MDKEMELLLSEKEINIGDKTIVVKRIALLDTIRIASKVSEIVSLVLNSSEAFDTALSKIFYNGITKDEDGKESKLDDTQLNAIRMTGVLELVGLVGDDAVNLLRTIIVKSTNLTQEEADTIDSVDGIDLLETIYEVNKGFFKKCMSKLNGLKKASAKKTKTK